MRPIKKNRGKNKIKIYTYFLLALTNVGGACVSLYSLGFCNALVSSLGSGKECLFCYSSIGFYTGLLIRESSYVNLLFRWLKVLNTARGSMVTPLFPRELPPLTICKSKKSCVNSQIFLCIVL